MYLYVFYNFYILMYFICVYRRRQVDILDHEYVLHRFMIQNVCSKSSIDTLIITVRTHAKEHR